MLNFPLEKVYVACSNLQHVQNWWGPKGFTNTFHKFDFEEGGQWSFIMHGPDGKNYPNECTFLIIVPNEMIILNHDSKPFFQLVLGFTKINEHSTNILFKQVFLTAKECENIKVFAKEKNEENLDRLELELQRMS